MDARTRGLNRKGEGKEDVGGNMRRDAYNLMKENGVLNYGGIRKINTEERR